MKHAKGKMGFTIVELLMVIGIIAVLLGLVTTAAVTMIRNARDRKATACQNIIAKGIATYREQMGEWPGALKDFSENGLPNNEQVHWLTTTEYDQVLTEVAKESVSGKGGRPMMDVSGLIVARKGGNGTTSYEFREAQKKEHHHGGSVKLAEMAFGYQDSGGTFHRFRIKYNALTDDIEVSK